MSGQKCRFGALSQLRRTMMERAAGCKSGRKRFFFEKRSKKLSFSWGLWRPRCHNLQEQNFLVLFLKKNRFPYFICVATWPFSALKPR
jgi:hypothetical protein